MIDPFVEINQKTGYFDFNNTHREETVVRIKISEFDYSNAFYFKPHEVDLESIRWDMAIEDILCAKEDAELVKIYDENADRIRKEWAEHRLDQLQEEQERIRELRGK